MPKTYPPMKPCPFCGSDHLCVCETMDEWSVHCTTENCRGESINPSYPSKKLAIEAWNKRELENKPELRFAI